MAVTTRKNVSKKAKDELDDEHVTRREKLTLVIYLLGGVAIIAGMVVLSQFLSAGEVDKPVWITGAALGGAALVGVLITYLMRRAEDK